jgi:hypothetical protein
MNEDMNTVLPADGSSTPRSRRRWIITGCVLLAFVLLAAILVVLMGGANVRQPITLEVIDEANSTNRLPATFSIGVPGQPVQFPSFSEDKARLRLASAVQSGLSTAFTVQVGVPIVIRIHIPQRVSTDSATGTLVIKNKSITLTVLGAARTVVRPDGFVTQFRVITSATNKLQTKYFGPGDKAYNNVFGGQTEAPRINIFDAIKATSYPDYKRGVDRAENLSSPNALVQAWLLLYQNCVNDSETGYSTEAYSDDPSVYLSSGSVSADAAATAAWNKSDAACNQSESRWNQLSALASQP